MPDVIYINLDRRIERRDYIEAHLTAYGVSNWQRFSAFDAATQEHLNRIAGDLPRELSASEIACTLSHLGAINQWLQSTDASATCCVILEDDCDLSSSDCWRFDWAELQTALPSDYDVVQLAITNPVKLIPTLHLRYSCDYCSAAYLLTRRYAEKLIALHREGERFRLDNACKPSAKCEYLIFGAGVCYSAALFSFLIRFSSDINDGHVNHLHRRSREATMRFWIADGAAIKASEFTRLQYEYVVPRLNLIARVIRRVKNTLAGFWFDG